MTNDIKENYEINGVNEVKISVIIGEEQGGEFSIYLDEDLLKEPTPIKVIGLPVGSGIAIKSRTLIISTRVDIVNQFNNKTIVTYFLEGGKPNDRNPFKTESYAINGELVLSHRAEITFV